jgi:RNA polymerase sigma-70 factor (ECF subfamily)
VYRVAANACLKMRPGKGQAPREIALEEVVPSPGGNGAPPQIADWSGLPLDNLLKGEMKDRLERAILALPKDYRVVLVLRDQEGFSTREAATTLGISETLAKVRLHRARLALRKSLSESLS